MDKTFNEDKLKLRRLFHRFIREIQKTRFELWGQKLEGATTIEVSVLSIVEHNPDIILKEIIQYLEIPGSTLTSTIDRLEKRGLISRTISKRDRRSYGLELTEKGKLAQIEHRNGEDILFGQILKSFNTPEEKNALYLVINKLTSNLEEINEHEHRV